MKRNKYPSIKITFHRLNSDLWITESKEIKDSTKIENCKNIQISANDYDLNDLHIDNELTVAESLSVDSKGDKLFGKVRTCFNM